LTPGRAAGGAFEDLSNRFRPILETRLGGVVPNDDSSLSLAMRGALLSPGKRIRGLVAIAAGRLFRGAAAPLVEYAAAIEGVHAASLVLDDLPCMDDASLRRGEPALHVRFGEATAILAAVALINRSFELVAELEGSSDRVRSRLTAEVARAAGEAGCCRGQQHDLESDPARTDLDALERIHALKTGALFVAAARGGAVAARASEEEIEAMSRYAKNLGLAFQIVDDLLEEYGDERQTGKKARGEGHRASFARILGLESARTIAAELTDAAVDSIRVLGRRAEPLADLAYALKDRRS
jgi:geranylgeranyl pyrophosphate synthase